MALDKSAVQDKAQMYAAQGKLTEAIAEWKKLADLSPNDGTPYNAIGDLYLKKSATNDATEAYFKAAAAFRAGGVALKAIAVFKKILKIDPNQYVAYKFLADLNAERGLVSNAVADYLALSKLYLKASKPKEALETYRAVIKLEASNLDARRQMADLCLKQGWTEEGVKAFIELGRECANQRRPAEAKEAYQSAHKIDPKNREAEQLLQALESGGAAPPPSAGATSGAAGAQASQIDPNNLGAVAKPELLEYANTQMNSGQYGPAEAALSELLSREPGEPEVCRLLARVHLKAGQIVVARGEIQFFAETAIRSGEYKLAESMIQEFLEVNPTSVTMLELLGKVYEESGDKATAVTHYGRAVEALLEHPDPDNPTLPIEIFEKIKEIASSSPVVAKLAALFQAGHAAPAAPEPAAAAPAAEAPAPEQHNEQELMVRYELGVAYKDMGLFDEAMEELQVALKGPACFVNASHAVALCMKAQGKTKDAIGYLEHAVADHGCVGDLATMVR
ncbi:MAG: tetratricopeptide repeat protein, partial [Nitrospirae bacterium]|nr:tetratricopeptide repeat protein [Nitrospirota bacterium]